MQVDSAASANLVEIHQALSPPEFEKLVGLLLVKMGFTDVKVVAQPGDRGVDAEAMWAPQVPGLRIDLEFKVQAKRFLPTSVLPPRFVRELAGKLKPRQWGLLITTCRVSHQTRQEGLTDSAGVVLVIDGRQLVDLCRELGVGFKPEFRFDKGLLFPPVTDEVVPEPIVLKRFPLDLGEILGKSLGASFDRLGRSPIYRSKDMAILARWSQRYPRKDQNYWYGLTLKDLASVEEFGVSGFAYVCGDIGTILIPVKEMLAHVNSGKLGHSTKDGNLRHYHMQFGERGKEFEWVMKNGVRENVSKYFHARAT
jgi:hypothetical protein